MNEQPQNEQPQSEQPQSEQPQSGQPQSEQPQSEQPQSEQPQSEQPQSEQPQSEQPQNEQPQNEQPQSEQPQSGQPQSEQPQENEKKQEKKEKKDKKRRRYITVAIILLIIIIILLLLLLRRCSAEIPVLNPDYPPQADDPNATPIPDDTDDKLDHEEGGGAAGLVYKDKLTIDLSDKEASLTFANPGRSTQDMVVWLVIQDRVIIQSGRLRPGYQVDTLDLLKDAEKMLSEGVYEGKFVIYYYDPETNERAMVNTEAPVTVTVKP